MVPGILIILVNDSINSVEHNGIHLDTLKTENLAMKGPRSSALFNIMVFYLLETFDGTTLGVIQMCKSLKG